MMARNEVKKESWSQLVALPFSPARVIYRSFAFPPAVSLHFHFWFFFGFLVFSSPFPPFDISRAGPWLLLDGCFTRGAQHYLVISSRSLRLFACTDINPLHPFSPRFTSFVLSYSCIPFRWLAAFPTVSGFSLQQG